MLITASSLVATSDLLFCVLKKLGGAKLFGRAQVWEDRYYIEPPMRCGKCSCCGRGWGCCQEPCLLLKTRRGEDGGWDEMHPRACEHE